MAGSLGQMVADTLFEYAGPEAAEQLSLTTLDQTEQPSDSGESST